MKRAIGTLLLVVSLMASSPASAQPPDFSKIMEDTVREDGQAWMMNRYDYNSVRNVRNVRVVETQGDATVVQADYSYNGGMNGWVLARIRNGAVECVQYHDRRSCVAPRRARVAAAQGPGGVGVASTKDADCIRKEWLRTETQNTYRGNNLETIDSTYYYRYQNTCARPVTWNYTVMEASLGNLFQGAITGQARQEERSITIPASGSIKVMCTSGQFGSCFPTN